MENSKKLFGIALGLSESWFIKDVKFSSSDTSIGQLDIYLDFKKGAKFDDDDGNKCTVHDTVDKTWQHLDFFQHSCYLHARVPRILTNTKKVRMIKVPWARAGSGFTLLFEAFAMALIENEMPINKAASLLDVYANRLWTIFNYWIKRAFEKDDISDVQKIGIDETSTRKGHNYVMITADIDRRRVIFATPGKDENTVKELGNYLENKNVKPEQITHTVMDMSRSFIAGTIQTFPKSSIIFDRFHLKKLLNEALDSLRKVERKQHEELKGYKYLFLKKQKKLTEQQKDNKYEFIELFPKLGQGVRLVELFDDFFKFHDKEQASAYLAWWCDLAEESAIPSFRTFVKTVKSHWSGIINYFDAKISNGILEGINSKVQLAKRRARGYRNIKNFINMIYFIAGDLVFDYPRIST